MSWNLGTQRVIANHNHRPCRWYAQAPSGPFTSRAYRLVEFISLAYSALPPQMRL